MPFVDSSDKSVPKTTLRLRQDALDRPGKSNFTCLDAFWWTPEVGKEPGAIDTVAKGASTDLASIPPFLWGFIPSYGSHTMSAVLHDSQCKTARAQDRAYGASLHRHADGRFRETLRDDARVGGATHWIMWAAVRLFGDPKVGGTLGACIVIGLLHWAQELFASGANALSELTILPWLRPLAFVPRLAVEALAFAAELLRPDGRFVVVLALLASAFVLFVVLRSIESEAPGGPRRLDPKAVGSLLGAGLIAVLVAPPLLPLIVVTGLTSLLRMLMDLVVFVLTWLVNQLRPSVETTALPTLDIFPGP